jgi:NADH-quinone oxidoreductase subunit L
MEPDVYLWVIPALPLIGAVGIMLCGRNAPARQVGVIAAGSMALSFLLALRAVWMLANSPGPHLETAFTWIAAAEFSIGADFYMDRLSGAMTLLVTGAGMLLQAHWTRRISTEPGSQRSLVLYNLFVFFMLLLVLGGSYVLLFVGWQGAALCSLPLLQLHSRDEPSDSRIPALLLDGAGGVGFLLALLVTYDTFGSLSFGDVLRGAVEFSSATARPVQLVWIGLLLLVPAAAKVAQTMLYAGPGPSMSHRLVLTAPLLAAAAYLMLRSEPLYQAAPLALLAAAAVAAVAAFYAAARYHAILLRPLAWVAREVLWRGVDQLAIHGALNDVARAALRLGEVARRAQSGSVRSYAGWAALGTLLAIGLMVAVAQ